MLVETILAAALTLSQAPGGAPAVDPGPARQAIERAIGFLLTDAAAWRAERDCATCHHGAMTVWALSEARSQGYALDEAAAADVLDWTKTRFFERVDLPRDERPGWSMVSLPAMYLALSSETVDGQTAISAEERRRIAGHLVRHQEENGSWSWATAPAKNRPPPAFESDETATLLAYIALRGQPGEGAAPPAAVEPAAPPADAPATEAPATAAMPPDAATVQASRRRALEWLSGSERTATTQALALWLLADARDGLSPDELQPRIAALLARQNDDGGWGQLEGAASDGYATGQALYTLRIAGIEAERGELQRGVAFLLSTQREDGGWPMTPRAHPEATPASNVAPITHFGSAWATLGLLRCMPAAAPSDEGAAGHRSVP